jgi:transposase
MVDDWYQGHGQKMLQGKVGRKPEFSDSEVMTLMIAEDYIPYPAESQYIGYLRANHSELFPQLLDQSQFNRRARQLRYMVEAMRRDWLLELGIGQAPLYLIDIKRSKSRSYFAGSADYGYCASRKLHYFGYKLVMITTLEGMPVVYDLVSANTEERQAAEAVLDRITNAEIIGDKGFLGAEWQDQIKQQTGNTITTPKRKNQKLQHPEGFERLLNHVRERIEGVFHELQNTGRNLERLLAKTVDGLATRVIAKVTAHLLKHILRCRYQIDVQTFQCSTDLAF